MNKTWFKIEFNDIFLNGLTTAEIGCVVKYRALCQQFDLDVLDERRLKSNFSVRERKFLNEYLGLENQKSVQSKSKVSQKFVQNESKVCSKSVQSLSEVCSKISNENNELDENPSRADINNNKNNTLKREDKNNPSLYSSPLKKFKPPELEEVKAYIAEKKMTVSAEKFMAYFTEGGWKDSEGKPVKNWKQKLITWDTNGRKNYTAPKPAETYQVRGDTEELNKLAAIGEATKERLMQQAISKYGGN